MQKKAFKSRRSQKYFTIEVTEHKDGAEAPLELKYKIDQKAADKDAELDGVYTLVVGGKALELEDQEVFKEWKGQHKIEHAFSMVNEVLLNLAVFLKKPARIVSCLLLVMVGALVAGLIERQIRRAVEELQKPIEGLMPEGRDTLRPTIGRIFKAFANFSLVQLRNTDGTILMRRFTTLDPVQKQIWELLGLGQPETFFNDMELI